MNRLALENEGGWLILAILIALLVVFLIKERIEARRFRRARYQAHPMRRN